MRKRTIIAQAIQGYAATRPCTIEVLGRSSDRTCTPIPVRAFDTLAYLSLFFVSFALFLSFFSVSLCVRVCVCISSIL